MPPSLLVTGVRGGHDLDLWRLQADGAVLLGRLLGIEDDIAAFDDDADTVVAAADRTYADFVAMADAYAARNGLDLPSEQVEPTSTKRLPTVPRVD